MTENVNDVRPPGQWVTYPPIVPLETASSLVLTPPWNYKTTDPVGPPRDALAAFFCKALPSWLTENDVGGVTDLVGVHENVAIASVVLEAMFSDYMQVCRTRNHPPSRRTIIAVRLVSYGAHQVSAAHVMHLRDEAFYQVGALSLARTAIELVARGGWVAVGEGNEPDKVVYGPRLATHRERRQHEVNTTECMTAIARKASRAWPEADPPVEVYRYLNQFTHFDGRVIDLLGATDARDVLRVNAYDYLDEVMAMVVELGGAGRFQTHEHLLSEIEPMLAELLLKEATAFGSSDSVDEQAPPRECHVGSRKLSARLQADLWSGFALNDGIWRVHSWVVKDGEIIEATPVHRERYVGVPLNTRSGSRSAFRRFLIVVASFDSIKRPRWRQSPS